MTGTKAIESLIPKPSPALVADAFRLVVTSANEWVAVVAQERSRREDIRAWERIQLDIIRAQRDFLLKALDRSFDERAENFRRLFDALDAAMVSDRDNAAAQAADTLGAITDLARTSPFKDLKSPELVVQEFLQSGRAIAV